MSFTAEEIARFDGILSDMFESELTVTIFVELVFLALILAIVLLPRSFWRDTKWKDAETAYLHEPKGSRYRNGKKLTRREREAEENRRKKHMKEPVDAIRALILCALIGVAVAGGIAVSLRLSHMQRDMDEDAYAVYEGVFDCGYEGSYIEVTLTFPDGSGNTVSVKGDEHDLDYPEVGKHRGRVVYAKNSGYVIEVEWDPTEP